MCVCLFKKITTSYFVLLLLLGREAPISNAVGVAHVSVVYATAWQTSLVPPVSVTRGTV